MKLSRACLLAFLWTLLCLTPSADAQTGYQPGQVVGTNFGFVNRYRWTNDNGQIFVSNAVFRLSDFDGKIVFFVFFDVW